MSHNFDIDICVIGAGPAGSVVSKQLVDLGYSVAIIESKPFPRPNVGICLSDDTYKLLNHIGVKSELEEEAFFKRKTTYVRWNSEEAVLSPQPGFHVDRGKFDQLLLKKAMSSGVKVIQPAKARRTSPLGEGWEIEYDCEDERKKITAKFLINAVGRTNLMPAKKIRLAPPLFAVHSKWKLNSNPKFDGFIESAEDSWLWFAQIGEDEALITLFTDPKHFAKSESNELETHYIKMIEQFSLIQSFQLGTMTTPIESCDASSRYTTDPIGLNYIRIGDANLNVDPIASQGVHLALLSALQATAVVNTLLRNPENSENAIEFYKSRQLERIEQFTERTASVYREVIRFQTFPFWKTRSAYDKIYKDPFTPNIHNPKANEALQLSSDAEFRKLPIMQADLIDSALALHHPSLNRPIVFLAEKNVVELLTNVQQGETSEQLVNKWINVMPRDLAKQILAWLWSYKILISVDIKS